MKSRAGPLCSLAILSNLQAEWASEAQTLAITSFVLKLHYSYSYCSLLSNSLRKECARKTKIFMVAKELHEQKHNSPLPSEAVCLTVPTSQTAAYFSTRPGACLPQSHKSLPLLQMGHLEATIYPQHREYGQLPICSEYNMPEEWTLQKISLVQRQGWGRRRWWEGPSLRGKTAKDCRGTRIWLPKLVRTVKKLKWWRSHSLLCSKRNSTFSFSQIHKVYFKLPSGFSPVRVYL